MHSYTHSLKDVMVQPHPDCMLAPTVNPLEQVDSQHDKAQILIHIPSIHGNDCKHNVYWEYKLALPMCSQHKHGYSCTQGCPHIHSNIPRFERYWDTLYLSDQYDEAML